MKKSVLSIVCVIFVSGCTVTAPSIDLPRVDIESPVKVVPSGNTGGKGCPPGLAKQGRC